MREKFFGELKPANSAQEMRAELFRLSFDNSIVRCIFDKANYMGLSGEDKYTELAYHALKILIELQENQVNFFNSHPTPRPVIIKECKK